MNKPKPAGRNDGHIMDYTKIDDNIYIGSNLCKGSVCPVHEPEFTKLGVCVEINLDNEKKETPPDNIDTYVWMPVVDGHPPSPDQLDLGSALINQAVKNNKTVYVHCKNGHGRSPTLIAAYYIRYYRITLSEAEKIIKKKRSEIHIEKTQIKALKDFEQKWLK